MDSIKSSPKNIVSKETVKYSYAFVELPFGHFEVSYSLYSPEFSPPNSIHKFQFELRLSPVSKMISFVLIYNGPKKGVTFYYRHAILDANEREQHLREHRWTYEGLRYTQSYFGTFCQRDYAKPSPKSNSTIYIPLNEYEKLLVNGSVTIQCEVDIFEEYSPNESFGKLSDNYEAFVKSGKLTDFIVLIGEKEFPVHKAILAAQSAVFSAMFEHADTQEVKEGRVVVEDVDVEAFEMLIRYIYTGKVDDLGEHATELFVAADKYQLDHLKSICEHSLISSLTVESVCAVLLRSDMHNAEQLKSKCIEYIMEQAKEVMKTEGWKQLVKSNRIDLVAELCEKLANKDEDD